MPTHVLILCPHNAAKSVTAAAYLERIAASRGLDITIDTAGTDPDDDVVALVREQLENDGYEVTTVPRLLTENDMQSADHVINIGCSIDHLPSHRARQDWAIPNFSESPSEAFAAISEHVEQLAAALFD